MPINTTITAATDTGTIKEFYDRKMLEYAKTQFVYANFGQKRTIPKNNGKRVEFRRWNLFTPSTTATKLTEGVTPDSQKISQAIVTAEIDQYGAYVEVSDMLDLVAYDPVVSDCAELLGEQMGTVLDWLTRDAMIADASVQLAAGKTDPIEIAPTDVLTVDEIRKAVRTLKKSKARRFNGNGRAGHFVCICDPDVTYDLQNDPLWQDVSKYANAEQIYAGELGRLFGVVFVESTEGSVTYNIEGVELHNTLIFGADAYGLIDIAGSGTIQSFIKPAGSAGSADPLNQRSTVGCKIMGYTAKVLNSLWIINIISGASDTPPPIE